MIPDHPPRALLLSAPPVQRAAVRGGAMVASVGIVLVIAVLDAALRSLMQ